MLRTTTSNIVEGQTAGMTHSQPSKQRPFCSNLRDRTLIRKILDVFFAKVIQDIRISMAPNIFEIYRNINREIDV